jgi:hypothetical protein
MKAFLRFIFGDIFAGVPPAKPDSGKPVEKDFFLTETKLSFEETVSQMSRGYDNTQRMIQFMDAKAGAVVALSLAVYAFVGKVVAWAFEKTDATVVKEFPCWLVCVLIVLGLAIMACGFISLSFAFKTLRPNPLPSWGAFSTLFPAHGKEDESKARAKLNPIVAGATCGFVVAEFENQLVAIGQIVHRKINWLRFSINWLWWQGLASALLGGVISGMAMSGKLIKSVPSAPAGRSVPFVVALPVSPPMIPSASGTQQATDTQVQPSVVSP